MAMANNPQDALAAELFPTTEAAPAAPQVGEQAPAVPAQTEPPQQTTQQPPVEQTPAQTPQEGEPAPAATEEPPQSPQEPTESDVDQYFQDFAQETITPVEQAPTEGAAPSTAANPFSSLSEAFGQTFSSVDDVRSYIDEQVQSAKQSAAYPVELDEATRTLADDLISREVLTERDIRENKVHVDYHDYSVDNLAHDYFLDKMSKSNPDVTDAEIQEKLDSLSDEAKEQYAMIYAERKNNEAQRALDQLSFRMETLREQKRMERLREKDEARIRQQQIVEASQQIKTIPGTDMEVTPQMQQLAAKALQDEGLLKKIVFGQNGDPKHGIVNVLRVAYAGSIAKHVQQNAAAQAKREVFEQATPAGQQRRETAANAVGSEAGMTTQQQQRSFIDNWTKDKSGLPFNQ